MAGNIKRQWEVAAQPWLVQAPDAATEAFLRSLSTGTDTVVAPASLSDDANDLGKTDEAQALWAVAVKGDPSHGEAGGTAYVVSAEAFKRLEAHRYTGG